MHHFESYVMALEDFMNRFAEALLLRTRTHFPVEAGYRLAESRIRMLDCVSW